MRGFLSVLLPALCCAAPAWAQPTTSVPSATQPTATATLRPGDKAPPLAVTHWFTALPTTQFERGKVYVVLFWAHWQPQSVQALDRLCEMVHEKTDATYIAIHDLDDKSPLAKVEAFCDDRKASLHCSVGMDELHATTNAWMKALGLSELPTAFIVNRDGRVAYAGPAMWIDGPLKDVVSGDWEPGKASGLIADLNARYAGMMKNAPALPVPGELSAGESAKSGDAAAFLKDYDYFQTNYPLAVLDKSDRKLAALFKLGRDKEAVEFAKSLTHPLFVRRDGEQMVRVAWTLLTAPGSRDKSDLNLARHLAFTADGVLQNKSPAAKVALAEAWFAQGATSFAIDEINKGLALATDPSQKSRMESLLKKYEAADAKQKKPAPPMKRRS